jgi:curli biogenesis system outer membrane secretion channel CsgG
VKVNPLFPDVTLLRRYGFVFFLLSLASSVAWSQGTAKRRVAVFDFSNAAIQGGINSPYLQTDTADIGKAISELLVIKLVQDGKVRVVERAAIDKILSEQNLSNSDRADPLTAAKLGKLLGVDAIILGAITHYDYDEKLKGYVGGGRRRRGTAPPQAKYDMTAKLQISARLVSSDTAEVLAVSEGLGETDRKNVIMDVRDTSGKVMQAVGPNNPALNEAMDKAVAQVATELAPQFAKLPLRTPSIEGMVADANDSGKLVLNVGAQHGLKVGDHLQVLRAGKEIRDPNNGRLLTRDDTVLGEAVVLSVTDISSIAQYKGNQPAQVRDLVKSMPAKP